MMRRIALGIAAAAMLTGGACLAQGSQDNRAAASGDTNQAVATTSADATRPAKGANSFTVGQARTRIEDHGYADVTDLTKDSDGVWRGKAKKDGNQTTVWLDYKGNVGQAQPQ